MSSPRIVLYNPESSQRTESTSKKEWDEYRAIITNLYREQDKILEEVIVTMEDEHGFSAT